MTLRTYISNYGLRYGLSNWLRCKRGKHDYRARYDPTGVQYINESWKPTLIWTANPYIERCVDCPSERLVKPIPGVIPR